MAGSNDGWLADLLMAPAADTISVHGLSLLSRCAGEQPHDILLEGGCSCLQLQHRPCQAPVMLCSLLCSSWKTQESTGICRAAHP